MLIKSLLNGKQINLTGDNTTITSSNFSVDQNGNMTCNNAVCNNISLASQHLSIDSSGIITSTVSNSAAGMTITNYDSSSQIKISPTFIILGEPNGTRLRLYKNNLSIAGGTSYMNATQMGATAMYADEFVNTSLEAKKKNFEEFKTAINIIKDTDIYKYNYKTEDDETKKHIGFVIGEKYNTPKEVISNNGEGIDTYSMASILWKAVQEQQEQIEQLQSKIKELEGNK